MTLSEEEGRELSGLAVSVGANDKEFVDVASTTYGALYQEALIAHESVMGLPEQRRNAHQPIFVWRAMFRPRVQRSEPWTARY